MTQPTGEHASGVKLASAYVEVTAKTGDAGRGVKEQLSTIEDHGKVVGNNTGRNIAEAVAASGEPAAQGFADRLMRYAQGPGRGVGANVGTAFTNGIVDGFRNSRLVDDADFLFNGFKEKSALEGAAAANSFHGRFIQLLAANRIDAEAEAEKTGAAVANKIRAGAEAAGEGFGLGESFKKASEGLGRLGGKFGEAGEAAGGLGEKLGGIAAPLAMFADPAVIGVGGVLALAGGLGVTIAKVNELGEQWENLGHNLEITTGATGERLEAMKDQVGSVYGQVTASMGQVESSVAAVNTAFRDTGSGATNVATQLSNLQSMVGAIDTTTLGTAFRGFNISGDAGQQTQVIDQLLKTSQDTQQPINTLIAAMERFAPIGDTFHLTMQNSLAMMDEFSRAGINPQNTLFALSRAANDATKSGKDFHTALQEDIDAIKNAPNEQAAQAAAKGLFGPTSGRGGAALVVQAVRSGNLNLDPATLANLEKADNLVNKTRADTMTWGDQWTLFKHKVSDALHPVAEQLHGVVAGAMENVVGWLTQHQQGIITFATNVVHGFERVGTVLVEAFHKAQPVISGFIGAVGPSVMKLAESFGPLIVAIGRDLIPVAKLLGAVLVISLRGAATVLPPVINGITHIVHAITDMYNWLHDKVPQAWHFAFDTAKGIISSVVDVVKDIAHQVGTVLVGALNIVKPIFHDVFAGPLDVIKEIASAIDGIINKLEGPFKSAIHDLSSIGSGINSGISSAIHGLGFRYGGVVHAQDGLALSGYGGGDIIPALLEPGEHVVPKEEVSAAGGHSNISLLRALIRAGIMPDILGSMTGLGVAALGAGYREGGPVGFATGGAVGRHSAHTKVDTGFGHRVDTVIDKFVTTIGRTTDSVAGVNDSLDKLKGGDVGGGIDGLTKSFKNMQPVIKDVNQGLSVAKNNLPTTVPTVPTGRPSLSGLGDAARSVPHGWEDIGRHIERGRGIAEQGDQIAQQLGVEHGIPWLQAGAQILGQVKDLHDILSTVRGYVRGEDQSHRPHTLVGAPHEPGYAPHPSAAPHPGAPAHAPQHQAEPQRKPGGGGVIVNTLPIIGSIEKNDEGKYHSQALDTIGDAAGKTPGAGVLDNIFQKAPQTAGEWVGKKLQGGLSTLDRDIGKPISKFLGGLFFSGGPIRGPGPRGKDSLLIGAAPDEHMIPVNEVDAAGGHDGIYRIRAMIRAGMFQGLEGGGPVGSIDSFVASMQGTPYSQGARNDCSGMASQIANVALGLPPRSSMFTTRNEEQWLLAHGFKMGQGPPGTLRIGWYNHGSAPDDGHTAVTLPDGRPAESGGAHGNFLAGAGAAGADASEFDHHAYLPLNPQGPAVGGTGSGATGAVAALSGGSGGGSTGGGATAAGGDTGAGGGGTDLLGTFGDIAASGLRQNMLPGFSDPTQWGGIKSAAALMKFLATASGKPGSPLGMLAAARGTKGAAGLNLFGDLLSGSGGSVAHDIGDLVAPGQGGSGIQMGPPGGTPSPDAGAKPGGGDNVYNHTVNYNGPVNNPSTDPSAASTRQLLNGMRVVTGG